MGRVVHFYKQGTDHEPLEVGKLSWNGISWQATGEPWVRRVIDADDITSQRTGRRVRADDPEEFLNALPNYFRSPYLWASFPEDE